ncbi:MAG: Ig-like domain-containing protein [Acidobacteria bacterium]|nr:Ig-like domain-containing protein [Acidobacteriota bacterium]
MSAAARRAARPGSGVLGKARLLVPLWIVIAPGCAEDPGDTALDLELTPDPNLNTVEQVASAIETIVLVLDSPDGLYPPGSERVVGNLQIKNVDTDDEGEVVVLVPVPDRRLPWIRIRRGGLPPRAPLTIRVTGLARGGSATAIASGSVEGILFEEGEAVPVAIPFDLGPEVRPPRVQQVLPPDETNASGCVLDEVTIIFSEAVDEASVLADGAIVIVRDGEPIRTDVRLAGSGYIATVVPTGLSGVGMLRYRVTVSTSVVDLDGIPLDQTSAQDGNQPYEGDFQLTCAGP